VDQPVGTGFSYSSDLRDIRHDEEGVSEDMYDFFQVVFPENKWCLGALSWFDNCFFIPRDGLVHQIDSAVSTWCFPTVVSSHLCMLVAPNGRHFSKHTPNLQRITFLWQESHMQDIMYLLLLGAYIDLWKRRRVYLST
jgi:hypothetical protein